MKKNGSAFVRSSGLLYWAMGLMLVGVTAANASPIIFTINPYTQAGNFAFTPLSPTLFQDDSAYEPTSSDGLPPELTDVGGNITSIHDFTRGPYPLSIVSYVCERLNAAGDVLRGNVTVTGVTPTDDPLILIEEGIITFTGGTGVFAFASGGATYRSTVVSDDETRLTGSFSTQILGGELVIGAVSEPATFGLALLGMAGIGFSRRRFTQEKLA
jgi:hypothetical protein